MIEFINSEWIPYAVQMDIPCETFFSLTPKRLLRYSPYYVEQARRKRELTDETAWISNVYTLKAISTIGKGRYPDKPMDLYGVRKVINEYNEETEKASDADVFGAWAMAFNKIKFKKPEGTEVNDNGGH